MKLLSVERGEFNKQKAQSKTLHYLFVVQSFSLEVHVKLIQLSEAFYKKYPHEEYPEIMEKNLRPYYCFTVKIEDTIFAIPLRHHITHRYAFYTGAESGLDYKKAVIIEDPSYIADTTPHIDTTEFRIIMGNEDLIFHEFRKYIRQYKRARKSPDKVRSKSVLQYSTLGYFDF